MAETTIIIDSGHLNFTAAAIFSSSFLHFRLLCVKCEIEFALDTHFLC